MRPRVLELSGSDKVADPDTGNEEPPIKAAQGHTMHRFYVSDDGSAHTCHYSRDHNAPIAVSGVDTIDGKVKLFRGVVQSVEDYGTASASGRLRWRVTILDSLGSKVTILDSK